MRIVRSKKYTTSLQEIMKFISFDSKNRALGFRNQLDKQISNIVNMPYKCRKSIYFDDEDIRDLIYKGYTIVYKVDEEKSTITIAGIKKYKAEL
ncbi:type II toxin-antitoxin system RelE/ParE family toxin [Sulfurimonas autotrophica]|uniref:Plasmid stabilization system n=1 Tax=Sulfurimonas autotrophica (strain ATCC BAA-671 / DSM 16294 / JCM 11897 / OK10) TaxID=563040 RepID=E0US50_SULAO|nr:type II toxin-antitoxin system RelE/ParE family toxin [Sulfurimonas autotrophica]ADN09073.1 plasmid stabilization system [Sulfurimonas autotrophica DSM 16294]